MRYQYRFNKKERARLAALESILADTSITPKERLGALRAIERIEATAQKRAALTAPAEPQPADPTVDDMVSALEKAQKPTLTNQQLTDGPNAINAVTAPISAGDVSEPTQTPDGAEIDDLKAIQDLADGKKPQPVLEPVPEPTCRICHDPAPDPHMLWPMGNPNGKPLCPACYAQMCSITFHGEPVQPVPAAPPDWAGAFAAQRNAGSSDYQKSQALWAEQDRQAADERELEAREHAAAEAQYNAARVKWLQDGGRL